MFCLLYCALLDVVLEETIGTNTEGVTISEKTLSRTKVRVSYFRGNVETLGISEKGIQILKTLHNDL